MSDPTELCRLTATHAVELLQRRQVSSLELTDAAIARVEAVDGRINALPIRFFDAARDWARAFDDRRQNQSGDHPAGWLGGLPIAVKDFNNVGGQRTSSGSPIFEHHVAEQSDVTVARLQARGAIPIAKSNVPEFGGANTFNQLFGATRNPWNLERSAGGSSGGSAAALASGQVWLATGNDLGGSLRIPASFCGVAALRPSVGRVARPDFMPTFDSMGAEGPMGRTVADVALMLDAEAGPSPDDPFAYPAPPVPYAIQILAPCPRLRIGFSEDLGLMKIDAEVAALCRQATMRFTQIGADIDDVCPDFSGSIEAFLTLRAQLFATLWGHLVRDHADKLPPWILDNFKKGLDLRIDEIIRADQLRIALYKRVAQFFHTHDILAIPAVALPPFPVDQRFPTELAGQPLRSYLDWMFLTFVTTLTSCPVMSVPCGMTSDGLPVSLQLIGAPHSEGMLLRAARFIEEEAGVVSRLPLTP